MDPSVLGKLRQARRRLALAEFLRWSPWAIFTGFVLVTLSLALVVARGSIARPPADEVAIALGVPLLVAGLWAAFRWRSLPDVAREVDRRVGTKDRFSTFLSLDQASPSEFGSLSAREIGSYVSTLRLDVSMRPSVPVRSFLWTLLPILVLAALISLGESRRAASSSDRLKASRTLEKAREAVARQPVPDPVALKEIENAMEQVKTGSDPWKEAMSALADLENHLSAESSSQAGLSSEESAALAAAVAKDNPGLAQQLREGRQADAAQALSQMDADAVKKAMEDAAKHLESNRLRDLARQSAPEAQRSLAKIMRSSSDPSQGNGDGKRQLASAIQDAKNDSMGEQSSPGDTGKGQVPDSPNGKNPSKGNADNQPPGGAAGSDKDSGRGEDIAGHRDPTPADGSQDQTLASIEASGASVVDTYRDAGNDSSKAKKYRDMYHAASAAALDSINHEEIPAGSRLLVKRYFESIRPPE